jgi:hypothetical protein
MNNGAIEFSRIINELINCTPAENDTFSLISSSSDVDQAVSFSKDRQAIQITQQYLQTIAVVRKKCRLD